MLGSTELEESEVQQKPEQVPERGYGRSSQPSYSGLGRRGAGGAAPVPATLGLKQIPRKRGDH